MPLNAGDHGFNTSGQIPGDSNPVVERYGGFIIRKEVETKTCADGSPIIEERFYWPEGDDTFEMLAECRADIDDWNFSHVDDDVNPHEDTPALDRPWWETER